MASSDWRIVSFVHPPEVGGYEIRSRLKPANRVEG
ncbi:hypothetical protein M2350_001262 [Candidatus Fervidibacter sacchari]|uniref:Uncharacterized protein n=1 Tax=Candidatus Fervidibacter sacchari TaxID=1448929 RepID=A0ABT2ELP3_9BACT|nr:hypothetical protein [Candidatus Fervidibacter sacchari]